MSGESLDDYSPTAGLARAQTIPARWYRDSRNYSTGRFSVKRENGVHHFHLPLDEALRHTA